MYGLERLLADGDEIGAIVYSNLIDAAARDNREVNAADGIAALLAGAHALAKALPGDRAANLGFYANLLRNHIAAIEREMPG